MRPPSRSNRGRRVWRSGANATTVGVRLSRRCSDLARTPAWLSATTREAATLAVARARACRSSRPSARRSRCSASASSAARSASAASAPPLRRDARDARLPPQDAATKKYRLGPRVLDLGFSAINSMELREVAAPHLRQLCDATGYTVNMAILDGARHRLRRALPQLAARPAARSTSTSTSARGCPRTAPRSARCCSRTCPPRARRAPRRIEFSRRGPNTITSRSALAAELERVRAQRLRRSTTRSSPTASARSPRRSSARDGDAVAAINLAVHSSMVSMARPRRTASETTLRRAAARHLRPARLPRH